MSSETKHPERLPSRERNRRKIAEAEWQHALERMRQRHSPDATLLELQGLAHTCRLVYQSWQQQCRVSLGRVVAEESPVSVVIQLGWRTPPKQIRVVYNPLTGMLRTVLPADAVPYYEVRSHD